MTRARERPDHSHTARVRLGMLILTLALGAQLAPSATAAASSLHWSEPASLPGGGTPSAVSCASESLCVAVEHQGDALSTAEPTVADPVWTSPAAIDLGHSLNAVSCAPTGPCVAVDARGDAFVSIGANASAWFGPSVADKGKVLTGVSCPSASLCVAVDEEGGVVSSTTPESGGWAPGASTGHHLTGVSCSSASLCVAVDSTGDVLSSTTPTSAAAWSVHQIDSTELLAVSCSAAGPCVAVDELGDALTSADAASRTPTWSQTQIGEGARLDAVACASSGLCGAVDAHGNALVSDDPATPQPGWSAAHPDSEPLAGISCLSGGFCLAVDTAGRSIGGRVPAPEATTLAPTEVTDTSATLAGVVDPNDAVLGACAFEYGTALPSAQAASCALLPEPLAGTQDVSAQLTGLAPNTTYHYRILASSPAGASAGADQTFTTPVSSHVALVHPNPSIGGTPAVGQTLTCHAGTPSGSTAQLTYAWLRDLIPIAAATGSTYAVRGQDSGAHLQCEVTATDGGGSASAKSAFVSIPVGGAPASAGETGVGAAVFRNGKLTVPIVCSTQAGSGCEVALRLTAVETLSGRRVVAVAARAKRGAHTRAAAVHNLKVTLASARVRLARGAHTTIAVALDTTGRRLLKALHHYSAYLYVSGTVIGVIEAQLAQQLLTLGSSTHAASTHAARRR